jgi:hypothetical protein
MQEAGVLHLPFPNMTVEAKMGGSHVLAVLSEPEGEENGQFLVSQLRVCEDTRGSYLVVPPESVFCRWDAATGGIEVRGYVSAWMPRDFHVGSNHNDTYSFSAAITLLFVALVLMNAAGVERKEIDPTGLNKARRKRGAQEIPKHYVIHVGRVYTTTGGSVARGSATGRTMPIHLRRAHNRNVRYGKGKTETKLMHFPAVLVNFKEGEVPPEYHVKL